MKKQRTYGKNKVVLDYNEVQGAIQLLSNYLDKHYLNFDRNAQLVGKINKLICTLQDTLMLTSSDKRQVVWNATKEQQELRDNLIRRNLAFELEEGPIKLVSKTFLESLIISLKGL